MTRKFDSNIYSLLFDNYSAAYNLDWGENLFKPVDGKQYDCKDLMIETLDTRQVYAVFNVQDGDSIMSFSTNVPGLYYADKASEKVYRVVTVIDNEFNIPVFKMYPVTNSDGWIVFSMDYHNLEQFSSSQNFGNEKFREIFDSMSEDSNPLLLFYKLK